MSETAASDPLDVASAERKLAALDAEIARQYAYFDSLRVTSGAAAGAVMIGWLFHWILEVASRVHWGFGLAASLSLIPAFVWIIRLVRRPPLAITRSFCAVSLLLGLTLAVVVGGWLSYMLDSQRFGAYTPASPPMDMFLRMYYFTLADLIPLDVTGTLHLESPVVADDFVAGLPLLAFKIFVVWYLFVEFGAWRQKRKDAGKEKSTDLAVFAAFVAAFVVLVLARMD